MFRKNATIVFVRFVLGTRTLLIQCKKGRLCIFTQKTIYFSSGLGKTTAHRHLQNVWITLRFYHRVLNNFFIPISRTNASAPISTRSCGQRISRKKESVPHVFKCLPTLVCCCLRVCFSVHIQYVAHTLVCALYEYLFLFTFNVSRINCNVRFSSAVSSIVWSYTWVLSSFPSISSLRRSCFIVMFCIFKNIKTLIDWYTTRKKSVEFSHLVVRIRGLFTKINAWEHSYWYCTL